jgi:hypothetical protein
MVFGIQAEAPCFTPISCEILRFVAAELFKVVAFVVPACQLDLISSGGAPRDDNGLTSGEEIAHVSDVHLQNPLRVVVTLVKLSNGDSLIRKDWHAFLRKRISFSSEVIRRHRVVDRVVTATVLIKFAIAAFIKLVKRRVVLFALP